jgi:hypothetical protein
MGGGVSGVSLKDADHLPPEQLDAKRVSGRGVSGVSGVSGISQTCINPIEGRILDVGEGGMDLATLAEIATGKTGEPKPEIP